MQLTANLYASVACQLNVKLRVRGEVAPGRRSSLDTMTLGLQWEADLSIWIRNGRELLPGILLISCYRRDIVCEGQVSERFSKNTL